MCETKQNDPLSTNEFFKNVANSTKYGKYIVTHRNAWNLPKVSKGVKWNKGSNV